MFQAVAANMALAKQKYWPFSGFWIGKGPFFQFLKSLLHSPLGKFFYKQPFVLTSANI